RRGPAEIPDDEAQSFFGIGAVRIPLLERPQAIQLENVVDAALQVLAGRQEWVDIERRQPTAFSRALLLSLLRPGPEGPQPHHHVNKPLHASLPILPQLLGRVWSGREKCSRGLSTPSSCSVPR